MSKPLPEYLGYEPGPWDYARRAKPVSIRYWVYRCKYCARVQRRYDGRPWNKEFYDRLNNSSWHAVDCPRKFYLAIQNAI